MLNGGISRILMRSGKDVDEEQYHCGSFCWMLWALSVGPSICSAKILTLGSSAEGLQKPSVVRTCFHLTPRISFVREESMWVRCSSSCWRAEYNSQPTFDVFL